MNHEFKVGDHVRWNSEAGHVTGRILKVHTRDVDYKGHTHRCSPDDPQYEIRSDKTEQVMVQFEMIARYILQRLAQFLKTFRCCGAATPVGVQEPACTGLGQLPIDCGITGVYVGLSGTRSNPMTYAKTSICVNYKYVDGWHVFASDQLPGLYVASQDAKQAFDDVGPSIKMLLKLDEGINAMVEPELTFGEFLESAKTDAEVDRPVVLSDKRFAVYAPREALAA